MITCLKCNENKEKSSFVKKSGARPSVVCFSCWKKFLTPNIVESVCLTSEGSCLLWPDQDRDSSYYNEIRIRLLKNKEEYIHVRCNKACMNSDHFFYFKTNSTPYWFKYGLNYKIDFSKPSDKEIMVLKLILMDRIIRKDDCWIFGESSSKKSNIKIGDNFTQVFTAPGNISGYYKDITIGDLGSGRIFYGSGISIGTTIDNLYSITRMHFTPLNGRLINSTIIDSVNSWYLVMDSSAIVENCKLITNGGGYSISPYGSVNYNVQVLYTATNEGFDNSGGDQDLMSPNYNITDVGLT
jgi:hypothetical protein